jgi:hypothetical protein
MPPGNGTLGQSGTLSPTVPRMLECRACLLIRRAARGGLLSRGADDSPERPASRRPDKTRGARSAPRELKRGTGRTLHAFVRIETGAPNARVQGAPTSEARRVPASPAGRRSPGTRGSAAPHANHESRATHAASARVSEQAEAAMGHPTSRRDDEKHRHRPEHTTNPSAFAKQEALSVRGTAHATWADER